MRSGNLTRVGVRLAGIRPVNSTSIMLKKFLIHCFLPPIRGIGLSASCASDFVDPFLTFRGRFRRHADQPQRDHAYRH